MAKASGNRRRARESAMQILCVLDRQPELLPGQATALYFAHLLGDDGESSTSIDERTLPSDYRLFAETLVSGVRKAQSDIDALLSRSSKNWRLSRMAVPDRNILRLACFELMFCPEVPARAVLNEAIEIARRFGTSDSSSFVNGVLDRVVVELGRRQDTEHATESESAPA
ncbi:MAG TPA: transcription antitermination factor NusB [Pseudomonadota bacterium]|nr:transcription antitermination factor NusB [Pseudomonadota bacterium]HNO69640.1 transcription antitermination factor NusB [Pseudomonadota bacterium]